MKSLFTLLALSISFTAVSAERGERRDTFLEELKSAKEYFFIKQNQPGDINLLKWVHVKKHYPMPKEKYTRDDSFSGFRNIKNDGSCLDVRGLVLRRDSEIEITLTKNCQAGKGRWYDPYTDVTYYSGGELDIDHVVPLKHAFLTGGYKWSRAKRCSYENFMANDYHLMTVHDKANMKKGDSPPGLVTNTYMPPNEAYHCEYLSRWLRVKAVWKLAILPSEKKAISELIEARDCSADDFVMDRAEFEATQDESEITQPGCESQSTSLPEYTH